MISIICVFLWWACRWVTSCLGNPLVPTILPTLFPSHSLSRHFRSSVIGGGYESVLIKSFDYNEANVATPAKWRNICRTVLSGSQKSHCYVTGLMSLLRQMRPEGRVAIYAMSNQISCIYIAQRLWSHCLCGLYNLYSEQHSQSLDPRFEWRKTCHVEQKPF